MKNKICITLLTLTGLISALTASGQASNDSLPQKYVFATQHSIPATVVKDQYASGTCWSFATTSFLESELLRLTKDTFDLSEMYFVREAYIAKAVQFVRLHGTANFGQGGQAHDVMNVVRKSGMLTESKYSGLSNGQTKPSHAELESVLSAIVTTVAKNPGGKISPEWSKSISAVLDVYMGKLPEKTSDKADEKAFSKINPNDYVEITSYNHHPFYTSFALEIPDNWSGGLYYNVTIDDLIQIMDYAFSNSYSVCWDGDVSDKGFSHQKGVAVVPESNLDNMPATERSRWEKLSEKDRKAQMYTFDKPAPEKNITQEIRQIAFDNFSSTDDHLMHMTGTVIDQFGKRYFRTKNSWAADSNSEGGYLNISEAYVRLNTIAILVHKDAIPKEIRKKLGIN